MSSKDYSKKDIAKQFDLPERKSKIATLLKETDVYCICRSSDSTRFMIACDNCEEWYHGDCISITESDSRYIKKYFCPPCMERNPSLEIEYKKAKPSSSSIKHKQKAGTSDKKYDSKKLTPSKKPSHSHHQGEVSFLSKSSRCGACSGCLAVVDCMRCDSCTRNKYDDKKRRICRKRECQNKDGSDSDYGPKKPSLTVLSERQVDVTDEEDNWTPSPVKQKKQKSTPSSKRGKKKQKGGKETIGAGRAQSKRTQHDFSSSPHHSSAGSDSEDDRQCFWLECTNAARKGSKYCSHECCLKLATERLYRILPGRIQEWNLTGSVAEENNRKELEDIRKKQMETKSKISELEQKRADLDHHIHNKQQVNVDPDAEDEDEEEGVIHCITCGHEVAVKNCLKHMERCYNKYESQTSFGSIYKTKLEGTPIFCDFYNPATGTYCKRLAVLCPEHSRDPKILDTEVCGSPLVKNLSESAGKFCRVPKKKCNKHFCWEKLRRAEIDMERVRHWLKLDELFEQERQIRLAMSNRGGVVGLLLHSTFDHDLRNKIQSQQLKQEQEASLKTNTDEDRNASVASSDEDLDSPTARDDKIDEMTNALHERKPELSASKLIQKILSSKEKS